MTKLAVVGHGGMETVPTKQTLGPRSPSYPYLEYRVSTLPCPAYLLHACCWSQLYCIDQVILRRLTFHRNSKYRLLVEYKLSSVVHHSIGKSYLGLLNVLNLLKRRTQHTAHSPGIVAAVCNKPCLLSRIPKSGIFVWFHNCSTFT